MALVLVACLCLKDGEGLPQPKRPTYSQPSIMPRKQWVVVKTERVEDDDLIVVSGEEGGEEEEDEEDEREMELVRERERTDFSISNVRSLSGELGGRSESDLDSQVISAFQMFHTDANVYQDILLCVFRWIIVSLQRTTSSLKVV